MKTKRFLIKNTIVQSNNGSRAQNSIFKSLTTTTRVGSIAYDDDRWFFIVYSLAYYTLKRLRITRIKSTVMIISGVKKTDYSICVHVSKYDIRVENSNDNNDRVDKNNSGLSLSRRTGPLEEFHRRRRKLIMNYTQGRACASREFVARARY